MKITQEYLKERYRYDSDTGHFILIKPCQGVKLGAIVGRVHNSWNGKKYWKMEIGRKNYQAHRLVWLYVYGVDPHDTIDHEDGNGLNNRIDNLRCVTIQENNMNKKMYSNNKSGISGVCWLSNKSRWQVQMKDGDKNRKFGLFKNLFDAACCAINARRMIGYHSNHGSHRLL